jgi:carboxylate-amine ligase
MSSDEPHTFGSAIVLARRRRGLFLIDPHTGAQIDASDAVLARLGAGRGRAERELHACQIELITDVCATTAEAVQTLAGLRAAVVSTGAGVLGAGAHPAAPEGAGEITDKERYARISDLWATRLPSRLGLRPRRHARCRDRDPCVQRPAPHLPMLQALGPLTVSARP